ncbi:hypothetical protein AVEN_133254-1 [Araneus ventricosus]|uniref:Uncharacterized protein n=1 Tax=Araneus ventricosus TaxID=182803 RepID=A0A4Y2SY78_ARAVE|nr:hypothetical protein AVEN_133254-1 [Araneus ventricosus]
MTRTTPEMAPPLQTSARHKRENFWTPTYDLTFNRPTNSNLQWNQVSNLQPTGSKVETLQQGHRGPLGAFNVRVCCDLLGSPVTAISREKTEFGHEGSECGFTGAQHISCFVFYSR